jgi:leucyl/phenylalanyl-tRNA--protein transferase
MEACRSGEREGQTWIHDEVVEAYCKLHDIGMAHSLEVWKDDVLCGGLYGVSLGGIFFGESMFSREPNASKAALIQLCRFLPQLEIHLIDCQVQNDHLLSLGAVKLKRDLFLDELEVLLQKPMVKGPWDEAFGNWLSSV